MIATRRFRLAARIAAARFVPPGSRRRSRARLPAWLPLALRWKLRGKPRALALSTAAAVALRIIHTSHTHWHVAGRRRKWPERVHFLPPAVVSVKEFPRAAPITLLTERSQVSPLLIREPHNVSTVVNSQIEFTSAESTRIQPISFRKRGSRLARVTRTGQARQTVLAKLAALGPESATPATISHRSEHQWRAPQSGEQPKNGRQRPKADRENLPTIAGTASHRGAGKTIILASGHLPGPSRRWPLSKKQTTLEAASDQRCAGMASPRNMTEMAILPSDKIGVGWRRRRSKKLQTKLATSQDEASTAPNLRRSGTEAAIQLMRDAPPDLVWRAPQANKLQTSVDIDKGEASRWTTSSSPHAGGTIASLQEKPCLEKISSPARMTSLDPALVDRLADDVIRRIERQMRIERERCGL